MKRYNAVLLLGLASCIAPSVFAQAANAQNQAAQKEDQAAQKIEEVTVYGRLPGDTIKDIPQSVTIFNKEVMEISPVTTVGDMIRFIPTATRNGSTLNSFGDTYLVRGFGTSQTINGLGLNRVSHARDVANVERIEVLKGPSAILYGQMEPGAVINIVTKQPLDEFKAEVGLEHGSYNNQRYTTDITGPLTDSIRGRLNIAYQNSEAVVDFWDLEHVFIAPNLTMDITEKTNLTIEGTYSKNNWGSFQNGRPAAGAFLPNPNGKYPESFNPDEENIGFTRRDSSDINIRLTHSINDDLLFRASHTKTRNDADFKEAFVVGLEDDFRTINRFYFVGKNAYENDNTSLLDLTGEITTGSLVHKFVAGVSYRDLDSERPARFVAGTSLDMYNPVYGLAPDVNPALPNSFQYFKSLEGFIQNRISMSDKLSVLVGARYTDASQDTKFISVLGEETPDQLDEINWTTQFGFLYDFTEGFALYGNRSESFVPQFGTSSGGSPFAAEESVQYEIGTRYDLGETGLQANAAIFTITKDNVVTADSKNPGFNAAIGEVESKGFELSVGGHIKPNWYINAAYGFTETEIVRNFDGLQGNPMRNTPKNTFSMQSRFDITTGILKGLGLGGTVEYIQDRYGDDASSFELPGYTRLDLGAYYAVNEQTQIDLLLNNVTDDDIYIEGYDLMRVIQEPGLTFLVRLKYRFQ